MLSQQTLSLLSELQAKSSAAYPEGGLLYTYVEAANQAHSRYPSGSSASSGLSPGELKDLGRFLRLSQGDYHRESMMPQLFEAAEGLINCLQTDLNFDEVSYLVRDEGDDMTIKLSMARRLDNRYFELELWWSVD
ncbi:hypothetical protein [Pseudomonas sp. TUM22785]|uniref:hypothetical protein n=1 Tax=Pseudomonas sp. TUM22785 TaxID=3019098 RepID=UPI0023065FAB|nr:hypothetical protein [Pseudomonas sp. TUM22785]WCD81870.1 hypothetical protein PI990_07585 [Pseudomonas sp. TUM22785]